jgi:Nucleoporin complex subunit 54
VIEKAERDNPEPDALEAVRELGIAALRKRFETQNSECEKYRVHAADLRGIVEAVDKSTRQTGLRVEALQLKQKQLYNKMLSVVRSVEVLRCQGVPIESSERRCDSPKVTFLSDL